MTAEKNLERIRPLSVRFVSLLVYFHLLLFISIYFRSLSQRYPEQVKRPESREDFFSPAKIRTHFPYASVADFGEGVFETQSNRNTVGNFFGRRQKIPGHPPGRFCFTVLRYAWRSRRP